MYFVMVKKVRKRRSFRETSGLLMPPDAYPASTLKDRVTFLVEMPGAQWQTLLVLTNARLTFLDRWKATVPRPLGVTIFRLEIMYVTSEQMDFRDEADFLFSFPAVASEEAHIPEGAATSWWGLQQSG